MQDLKQQQILVCGVVLCVLCTACGRARGAEDQTATATDDHAAYAFDYAVNDPLTGDVKDQRETRSGDAVVGYYRTMDADGLVRTVRYQADAVNGFQAEVVREPAAPGAAGAAAGNGLATTAPAPYPAAAAAYYRGLPSAYQYPPAYLPPPYVPAAYQPYSAYAAYQPPYSPYAYQPYSAYAYQSPPYAYQPYGRGARYTVNGVQYAAR